MFQLLEISHQHYISQQCITLNFQSVFILNHHLRQNKSSTLPCTQWQVKKPLDVK